MFASLEIKAIIFAVAMGAAAIGGGVLMHKLDAAKYAKLELSIATAHAAALDAAITEQKRMDDIARTAAQQEVDTQRRLASQAQIDLRRAKAMPTHCAVLEKWALENYLNAVANTEQLDAVIKNLREMYGVQKP